MYKAWTNALVGSEKKVEYRGSPRKGMRRAKGQRYEGRRPTIRRRPLIERSRKRAFDVGSAMLVFFVVTFAASAVTVAFTGGSIKGGPIPFEALGVAALIGLSGAWYGGRC
jgi:hypothetical protein